MFTTFKRRATRDIFIMLFATATLTAVFPSHCLSQSPDQSGSNATNLTNPDLFRAAAIYNINKHKSYEMPALISFASHYALKNPDASSSEIQQVTNRYWNDYRKLRQTSLGNFDQSINASSLLLYSMLNILSATGSPATSAVVEEFTDWSTRFGNSLLAPDKQMSAQAHLLYNFQISSELQDRILRRAQRIASDRPAFHTAFDILFVSELGAQLSDDANRIIRNNPDYGQLLTQNKILDKLSRLPTQNRAEREKIAEEVITAVEDRTQQVIDEILHLSDNTTSLSQAFEHHLSQTAMVEEQREERRLKAGSGCNRTRRLALSRLSVFYCHWHARSRSRKTCWGDFRCCGQFFTSPHAI